MAGEYRRDEGGPATGAGALASGGCSAWPLPLDATCAREARRAFREAVAGLCLAAGLLSDGVTMASELAANTLHAHDNVELDGPAGCPPAGAPELWMYLRRAEGRWEIACKVFDSVAGWRGGRPPSPGGAGQASVSGRGLQVVAALSGGRWGHHLTRSRLGVRKVPGKVVWFAQPVPAASVPGRLRRSRVTPQRSARALEAMLSCRGLGQQVLRADEPDASKSVLSIRCGPTVWCTERVIWWQAGDGICQRHAPTDLVDTAEQIVRACEEMRGSGDPSSPAGPLARA